MRKINLILFFICIVSSSNAQLDYIKNRPLSVGAMARTVFYPGLSFAIEGIQTFYPGIKVGTEFDLKTWTKEKEKNSKTFFIEKSIYASPQLGLYVHPKNHAGLLLNAEIGYQVFRSKWGIHYAFGFGMGDIQRFNWGKTYATQPDGSIKEKKWGSRAYFFPSINLELGKTITFNLLWYSKITLGLLSSYNSGNWNIPEAFIETGLRFNFRDGSKE